jgi:PadR family transcriptional regulator, regulatory protein AphA
LQEIKLTPTSFVVLGLMSWLGEATPYDLKRAVNAGLDTIWILQHAQLYTEPERLAKAGYLTEKRETSGRRRKLYRLTKKGEAALREWVMTPTAEPTRLRDLGLLKLFFGANPAALGAVQLESHQRQLKQYEEQRRLADHGASGAIAEFRNGLDVLDAGIGHEREYVRFWKRLASRKA